MCSISELITVEQSPTAVCFLEYDSHVNVSYAILFTNAKDFHILSTKNNSVFAYVVGIYLTSCLNDDVKLTKF